MAPQPIDEGLLLSREAREQFDIDEALVDERGRVRLSNFVEVRQVVQALNRQAEPEQAVRAGQLGAVARLDEVARCLIARYRDEQDDDVLDEARGRLEEEFGQAELEAIVERFIAAFPPESMRTDGQTPAEYLAARPDAAHLVDVICVWLLNENPAVGRTRQLFDDTELTEDSYADLVDRLDVFFAEQPGFGPDDESLLRMLREPIERGGDSLERQLDFVRNRWSYLLDDELRRRLLTTLDVLREEQKAFRFPGAGPGPVEPPSFVGLDEEPERFSADLGWMPQLVLLAKNVHVWLTQLSRRYDQEISRLDEIPDAELKKLADWGVSGLWLIGLWQRSPASKRIKQLSGSPHVVSSAYSIYDYAIADDLGGEEAWQALRERAASFGVRMAADMVPNHMGVTSKWVYEHPEWLLSVDESPYPSYSFDGPDLSDDERVGVYLEDGYYDRSDAAVVFKRVDFEHGNTRYIYHGNDGTSMPWNDTAQIDYLNPQAREAVIEQILDVAKKSSIIRFDAAMTLVKKHIQRLWYPEPGAGGAIPSRAEHGMPKEDFERVMRREFWTEVVDRVAEEAPDTLLLAEAFWMMEGYFVRSLGMHRVYNSAFMNMLSDEDNAGYRKVMRDTLEFDPEILKRYVNFMNNPDEETAVAQFGKGDKYFGVCTLMATLPGLPMLGHGQIEGFVEKYGMDFNEPRLDETPDDALVERHRKEIFPLLRRRDLFAGVDNFLLYDVYSGNHTADENIFAFSNRRGERSALVVYHNKYAETQGWIRDSVPYRDKKVGGDGKIVRRRLIHGLDITPDPDVWVTFRDHVTGLEYIRSSTELADKGFFVRLGAYDYHVFLDFQQVRDTDDGQYSRLAEYLDGRGVPSLVAAMRHMELAPLHDAFDEALSFEMVTALAEGEADADLFEKLRPSILELGAVMGQCDGPTDIEAYVAEVAHDFEVLQKFEEMMDTTPALTGEEGGVSVRREPAWAILWAWALLRPIGGPEPTEKAGLHARSLFDEWALRSVLDEHFAAAGVDAERLDAAVQLVRFAVTHQGWLSDPFTYRQPPASLFTDLLDDPDARALLGVNFHGGTRWFGADAFGEFLHWLARLAAIYDALDSLRDGEQTRLDVPEPLRDNLEVLLRASKKSEYKVEELLRLVGEGTSA